MADFYGWNELPNNLKIQNPIQRITEGDMTPLLSMLNFLCESFTTKVRIKNEQFHISASKYHIDRVVDENNYIDVNGKVYLAQEGIPNAPKRGQFSHGNQALGK